MYLFDLKTHINTPCAIHVQKRYPDLKSCIKKAVTRKPAPTQLMNFKRIKPKLLYLIQSVCMTGTCCTRKYVLLFMIETDICYIQTKILHVTLLKHQSVFLSLSLCFAVPLSLFLSQNKKNKCWYLIYSFLFLITDIERHHNFCALPCMTTW